MRLQSRLWVFGLLILIFTFFSTSYHSIRQFESARAQDAGQGIDAPDTHAVDFLGISRTDTSQFEVTFEFEGQRLGGEPSTVTLGSTVAIQPDPPAYAVQTQAVGDLSLFRLVPVTSEQTEIENELVYLRRGLYTYIHFPQNAQESCGKNISGAAPALNRLQSQVPFPSSIFIEGSLPELPRVWPDVEYGNRVAAHYALEGFSSATINNGSVDIHWLPEEDRITYFAFEGTGQFYVQDTQIEGTLHYTYTLISDNELYDFGLHPNCEAPNVQGVAIFEPSPEWIVREDYGYYITNQSIENLIAFHDGNMTAQGFESLGEPLYRFGSAGLSYLANDGTWIRIDLYEDIDGTSVEIRVVE